MPAGGIRGVPRIATVLNGKRRGDGVPIIQRKPAICSVAGRSFELIDGLRTLSHHAGCATGKRGPACTSLPSGSAGQPLAGAELLAPVPEQDVAARDDGYRRARWPSLGCIPTHLPMSVFAAAEGFAAHVGIRVDSGSWITCSGPEPAARRRLIIFKRSGRLRFQGWRGD